MVSDLCGGKVTVFFLLTHMDRVCNPLRRKGLKYYGLGIVSTRFIKIQLVSSGGASDWNSAQRRKCPTSCDSICVKLTTNMY